MKAWVRRLIVAHQFNPTWVGAFVNPFYLARRGLWQAMVGFSTLATGRMLDVGCGSKPYRQLFSVAEYVGMELDTPLSRERAVADAYYDGTWFPFVDGEFDTVLCNQVLEHVFNPDQFLGEVQRVLAPGGRLLLTVPFVWDEHEQPNDYARYSSFGLEHLLLRNGLEVQHRRKLLADASILFQLANAYIYKVVQPRGRVVELLTTAILMGPLSLLGRAAQRVLPSNPDLFLDQAVVARRVDMAPVEPN